MLWEFFVIGRRHQRSLQLQSGLLNINEGDWCVTTFPRMSIAHVGHRGMRENAVDYLTVVFIFCCICCCFVSICWTSLRTWVKFLVAWNRVTSTSCRLNHSRRLSSAAGSRYPSATSASASMRTGTGCAYWSVRTSSMLDASTAGFRWVYAYVCLYLIYCLINWIN